MGKMMKDVRDKYVFNKKGTEVVMDKVTDEGGGGREGGREGDREKGGREEGKWEGSGGGRVASVRHVP